VTPLNLKQEQQLPEQEQNQNKKQITMNMQRLSWYLYAANYALPYDWFILIMLPSFASNYIFTLPVWAGFVKYV